MENDIVNIGIIIAYVLLGLAILSSVLLPLINAVGNPRTLLKGLVGVVFILIIYGIAYAVSADTVLPTYAKFNVGAGLSKYIGATLITMYILLCVSIIGIVYTEISKIFN